MKIFSIKEIVQATNDILNLKNNKLNYLDVKNTAMKSYNNKLQKKLSETVWASNCGSWYKTKEGKIINTGTTKMKILNKNIFNNIIANKFNFNRLH